MKIEFNIQQLPEEEEKAQAAIFQHPVGVCVSIEGNRKLAEAIIALLQTKYKLE